MEVGIKAFGGYIPRLRLSRESIAAANSWVDPSLLAHARSERSICDVDEDSITMAVEAARDCLNGIDCEDISSLYFASTTAPFDDRQNSAVIAKALKLREDITSLDISHSQRAGTSGLITALRAAAADGNGTSLYVAADHRQAKSATLQELLFGDGAAAITLGTTNVIANSLGKRDLISVKALQLANSDGTEAGHKSWDGSYFITTRAASKRAYEEAGIKNPREEISMFKVHDCFSITELATMEDLNISPEGGAIKNILDGFYDSDGKIPCQIDGGLKCFGHPIGASGLRMIYEMYLQLQGRADKRQLPDPKVGMTHNLGGFPHQNVCGISIIGRYDA